MLHHSSKSQMTAKDGADRSPLQRRYSTAQLSSLHGGNACCWISKFVWERESHVIDAIPSKLFQAYVREKSVQGAMVCPIECKVRDGPRTEPRVPASIASRPILAKHSFLVHIKHLPYRRTHRCTQYVRYGSYRTRLIRKLVRGSTRSGQAP